MSQVTAELVRDSLPEGTVLEDLGERELRGITRPERVFALVEGDAKAALASRDTKRGRARSWRPVLAAALAGGLLLAAFVVAMTVGGDEDDAPAAAARPLPAGSCSPVVTAAGASPRLLVAADLPLRGTYQSLGSEMDSAIRFALRGRDFHAGRHLLGYQACEEAGSDGGISDDRCEGNARAYAGNQSVVGVVGPFSSGCAGIQIPITNRAGLALVSPTNTHVGLTRAGAGAGPGEPDRFYPTHRRTYARVVADDSVQAAANAILARRLGVRRLFVLRSAADLSLQSMVDGVRFAAARLDVEVVGQATWDPSASRFSDLAQQVRHARSDGVFLAGSLTEHEGRLIEDLRAALPHAQLLGSDGFSGSDRLVDAAGAAAEGMTVTATGAPPGGSRGRAFVERLAADLGVAPEAYSIYAAQAAEVLLSAIERSDGSRASVTRELFRARARGTVIDHFRLTPAGDPAAPAISVYRIRGGRQELLTTIKPPRELIAGP